MDLLQALTGASHAISVLRTVKEVSASIDSMARVAEAQDALINVQNEVLKLQQLALQLQEENRQLRQKADTVDKKNNYELVRLRNGKTVVYKSRAGEVEHYACPLCLDRNGHALVLQDLNDRLFCIGCKSMFWT